MGQRVASTILRISLTLGFVLALVLQVLLLPHWASVTARDNPEYALLKWPVLTGSILWLLSVQVLLLAVWKLLAACDERKIFTSAALRWASVMIKALGAGCLLSGGFVVIDVIIAVGPISVPALGLMGFLTEAGLLSLMVVLRELLSDATLLQTEMAAVV